MCTYLKRQQIKNRMRMLIFLTTNPCFSSVPDREHFQLEKKFFIHEYISFRYRIMSYFLGSLGRLLSDLLPNYYIYLYNVFLVRDKVSGHILLHRDVPQNNGVPGHSHIFHTHYFFCSWLYLRENLRTMLPWFLWIKYFIISCYSYIALQHNKFL